MTATKNKNTGNIVLVHYINKNNIHDFSIVNERDAPQKALELLSRGMRSIEIPLFNIKIK